MRWLNQRLFLQIWAAFVLVAAACLVVAAAAARLTWDGDRRFVAHGAAIAALVARDLPPRGAPESDTLAALAALEEALDAQLVLWDGDAATSASGLDLPPPPPDGPPVRWIRGGVAARLDDGRWIAGQLHRDAHGGFLWVVVAVFATMALGCWPVARRIVSRLEAVERALDAWGEGRLDARAPEVGQDEVAAVARSFNAAAARVEALIDGQRRALASASHELRSPLARVRMAIGLMADDPPSPTVLGAERDLAELDALIADLLLSARLDAEPPLAREPVDLLALAAEEAARVGAVAGGQALTIDGDPRLLRRALRNLLENARRYSDDVEVAVDARGVEVRDRGPGVPEADRDRIFEPFYRPQGHREGDGGVGLGLALVRRIAARHDARVAALPREGGGSIFRFSLG